LGGLLFIVLVSFGLLLLFADFASANFKRLAPVLEAWDQSRAGSGPPTDSNPLPWIGGWEKLAAVVWAFALSIPLLAFALGCYLFLNDSVRAGNFIIGTAVGTNIIGLSLVFSLVLLSGPLTFFRVRTVTSPVFLLLATVVFAYACLNQVISSGEALVMLVLSAAYGLYFRRFSSEWKHYQRTFAGSSLLEATEGVLPVIALICMGIGFFLLAVLATYPLVQELARRAESTDMGTFRMGAHFVAFAVSLPWLIRCLLHVRSGTSSKALTITSISHACLLNVLLLPALAALLGVRDLAPELLSVHLPALFFLTGVFVSALLIEKEKGGKLPYFLIAGYLVYTGFGFL
jgi:Ca2+/Na+ antiporter